MRTALALLLLGALAAGEAAPLCAQSPAPPRAGSFAPRAGTAARVYGAPIGARILHRARKPRRAHLRSAGPPR